MSAVLERTRAQRMDALQQANQIRFGRARLKKLMRRGMVDVTVLITRPPAYLETMRVYDLLCAIPQCGPSRVRQLMRRLNIAEAKTLGGLSPRQRAELVAALRPVLSPLTPSTRERTSSAPAERTNRG